MYFKKLEMIGFKSFCEKTTLHFEPGITAIVGPNGTGKSNLFDAIRWVLGEQSVKSLRGSDMQDVIFSGTDSKEPLGLAEVKLTLSNENRFFNIEQDEVTITRKLFRSGESEYLLNRTAVRLKDILDLLLGTGIGAESYSLVAQGKIDQVLSSRPEDRRLVFDEASGITKYKAQKRESLRKLEETGQNLLRVNDIITEVKRQIGSLERQANKARRYKEVFEELKQKEISLAILQKKGLLAERDAVIDELSRLGLRETGLLDALRQHEDKISGQRQELKDLENKMLETRNEAMNLENQIIQKKGQMKLDSERIAELEQNKNYLEAQVGQLKCRIVQDEEKLSSVKKESCGLKQNIEDKKSQLAKKEEEINNLAQTIKRSLDNIALAKRKILELVAKIANANNEVADFNAKKQIFLARKKRLEIERAKAYEEKAYSEDNLEKVTEEAESLRKAVDELSNRISSIKTQTEGQLADLANINEGLEILDRQRLTLESHKGFLEKLITKYEDIGERMNAVIYLDKLPSERVDGLVVKIKNYASLSDEDKAYFDPASFKLSGEAKPMDLDTAKILEKLNSLQEKINILKSNKLARENRLKELNATIIQIQQDLRSQEIALANKEASRQTALEQFNRIKEEEDIIFMELGDVQKELQVLENNIASSQSRLDELSKEHLRTEDLIRKEEDSVSSGSKLREGLLVSIAQIKTELDGLSKRLSADETTLKILEDTYGQDNENLKNILAQLSQAEGKRESLELEIKECQNRICTSQKSVEEKNNLLKELENRYRQISGGISEVVAKIDSDKKELDSIKDGLHKLQMQNKDIDYKYESIKTRLLEAYKVDLEASREPAQEINLELVVRQIDELKRRLDSYGTVNLVAIEEYDELKKRYDFLLQQQNDLLKAKESLHEAISKINRTTKKMFIETFEKVGFEFRNYFRMLFNGGDAQVFLIDEQDPLESGIEIICRPPGKKLQNILLLSGGEKALSAIALVFAIFKVKPSPFCVLDEIDAALDEANVDRFSRLLQEFTKDSQFIVITHNKRTIANADVMYGITMEESGISKIVSVKFSKTPPVQDKELEPAVPEPV